MKRLPKILVTAILLLALGTYDNGSKAMIVKEPVCGGTIDNSFPAPKVIISKDLVSINTYFAYKERYDPFDYGHLDIRLERNENNELILSENNRYHVSVKVGEEVLGTAQTLITKLELARLNGTDRHTAGLPPPHFPVHFKAKYASGERIYFSVDGDPEAAWSNELAEYFLDVFADYGETSVLPPREKTAIVSFDIQYFDGKILYSYSHTDDGTKLLKSIYDYDLDRELHSESVAVPEGYYSELEIFLKGLKAHRLINGSGRADYILGTEAILICIEHPDWSQDLGSFEGADITSEMTGKTQKIIEFVDRYFTQ